MNWGNLLSEFHSYLGQDPDNPTFFESDDVRVFMEKAMRQAHANSQSIHKRAAIAITAGTAEYSLPSDCYEITRVAYDGYKIDAFAQQRLDAEYNTWREASGTPYLWYVDRINNKVGLYPKPDVSTTVAAATIEDGIIVGYGADEDTLIVDTSTADKMPLTEDGVVTVAITSGQLEVFYKAVPAAFSLASNPDIPQWAEHYLLFAALSEAFRVGIPDPDYERAAAFGQMAAMLEERIRIRVANVVPKVWNRNYGRGSKVRSLQTRFPAVIGDNP